ncbi:outer membrane lipoprotein carrier protein LolA [Azospirillum sp.]|uniref:outer membrane lipoprotein carrier protein LolA n=1 Tax=Azospirillum sp. TaxID=34012 RepID=UPI003D74C56D
MRRIVVFLLALAAFPALAAETLSDGQVLRGAFVQERFLKGFQAPLKSEGRFTLAPGRGLIWRTEAPFAVTTVMSPAGLVQEVKGSETMRLPAARMPFMSKLYTMLGGALTGDWKALEDMFAVERAGDAGAWTLHLTPRRADDPTMPIRAIDVRGGRFVEEVEIIKPDGDRDRLTFRDQRLKVEPPTADEAALLASAGRP